MTRKLSPLPQSYSTQQLLDEDMTEVDSFVHNGLLGKSLNAEVKFREGTAVEQTIENGSTFVANGLLSDFGGGLLDDGMEFDDDSQEKTLVDDHSVFQTNVLLDSASEVHEGFEQNGLLDRDNTEDSVPEFSLAAPDSRSEQVSRAEELLAESQDELPTLSDLLKPYVRNTSRPSNLDPGSFGARAGITATTFDGKALYLRRRTKPAPKRTETGNQRASKLLAIPIHRLLDQLSIDTAYRLAHPQQQESTTTLQPVENQLWVDRYRPHRFTELLGDERVHRETMCWLKEWDWCVFGKRKLKQKKAFENDEMNTYEDAYHRPREKILLLSGPAGFGKTTLAHVLARQAGYEVMEINASDARSGHVIDERVRPTLEAGSRVGSKKPVCVVIDEIDGATGAGDNASGFVQKLVSLTFDKPKKKGRSNKNEDTRRPLLRPIICICNDLYASSLVKLRQHARIIRFTRPADIYLTKRLRSICDNEGLRAESRALTALVGIAKGDMRGCLNTLQFIKARNLEVTEQVIRSATVGMKEADTSFISVLGNLFTPMTKKRVKEMDLSEEEENRYVARLSADVDASGSVDRVALGCFEHYANLRHFEATLDRHQKAAEWLVAFDTFSGTMRSEREYGLLPYLSYTLVPFYPLFNERGGSKVERPKADWENLTKTRASEEVYKSLVKGVQTSSVHRSPGLRHLLCNEVMQLEFAPLINRIISPPLRPVNSQVTKPQERIMLSRLVDIMVSLELRLIQDKTEDGQLVYRLDPPVDAFITYEGKRAADVAVQRYATRHLIAGEIDAKLIAKDAETNEKTKAKRPNIFKMAHKVAEDEAGEGADEAGEPNEDSLNALNSSPTRMSLSALGKRKAAEIDIADKPPVDFFGRPITTAPSAAKKSKGVVAPQAAKKVYRVTFKYNEGNSAAVRKPVKVSDFL